MVQLAFPLFSQQPALNSEKIAKDLQKRHRFYRFSSQAADRGVLGVSVDGASVLIALMPVPFPNADIEGLHPFARRGWHTSGIAPEMNVAHAIVTVHGAEDEKQAAIALTLIVEELCRSPNCMGVLWGTSGVLAHRSIIAEVAKNIARDAPPIALWVNAMPYQSESGVGLTTRGLASFIGRELHFIPSPRHEVGIVFQRAIDFAEYLYENGPVLLDNQSIGYSETDVLRAAWTEEMPDTGGEPLRWIELRVESIDRSA